jgi:hypothetical protein
MIIIQNRRASLEKLRQQYPDAAILDVTSHGPQPWIGFSPFYPHGGIPVPFSPGWSSASVEGVWQGLKVFERADIDTKKFAITTMKNLKRSVRTYGNVLGHRKGVEGDALLPYVQARHLIYLPTYKWVLEHALNELVTKLKQLADEKTLMLLDYETNGNIDDAARPLSHAALVKLYVEGTWPD